MCRREPNMISTLQDLIAPLTEPDFLTRIRDRTPALIRASEPRRFETLLDWDDLNHLVRSGIYPMEELHLRESVPIPTSFYVNQGRLDRSAFSSLMDRGADLTFGRLDKYVPRLGKLCHELAELTGEQVSAEAIVTSGKHEAGQRVSKKDICVLQIAGSKRWELCDPALTRRLNEMSVPPPPQCAPSFDEVLRVGDFLFLPAECSRRYENGLGRSLAVCIVLEPPGGREVITWLTNRLTTDDTFNGPLTRYSDPSALAVHEAALKARLIEQVQAWSLAQFLADRVVGRSNKPVIRIQGNAVKGPQA